MTEKSATTLRVAAVQMESENGQVAENLKRAVGPVEEAVERGARLVLLPEFLAAGYIFNASIWDAGEPREGPTVTWLKEHSKRLGVYLGSSFLEADGEDFFNAFVLTTPEGVEAGRVRKETPASFEAYFTKGGPGSHMIETDLGRIGVGICYENLLAYTPALMCAGDADLMLMPHSAPSPASGMLTPKKMIEVYDENLKDVAGFYARNLGRPTIMCNKCGPWISPLPGLPYLDQRSSFPGLSAIADSDGAVKAQLGDAPGVIVEDVLLDPARKSNAWTNSRGRWSMALPLAINSFRLVEALGRVWYHRSELRRRKAREISGST